MVLMLRRYLNCYLTTLCKASLSIRELCGQNLAVFNDAVVEVKCEIHGVRHMWTWKDFCGREVQCSS